MANERNPAVEGDEREQRRKRTQLTSERDMLTSGELQTWLGLGRTKVFELLNTPTSKGGIPNHRVGRKIIIRRRDVEDWLEQIRYLPEEQ